MKDYIGIGDFLEEFTGQSTGSYMSGCGLFYTKYEEQYRQMISDFIFDCYKEVLSEIDDVYLIELLMTNGYEVSEADKQDIIQRITDVELFEEPFWYHIEILEQIKPINFEFMILRGKNGAMEKFDDQEREMKERCERITVEKRTAEKLWAKLQKLHQLQCGKKIQKIEMKDYKMFIQFLDHNQVAGEDRIILANHLGCNFSTKVREYLCR